MKQSVRVKAIRFLDNVRSVSALIHVLSDELLLFLESLPCTCSRCSEDSKKKPDSSTVN